MGKTTKLICLWSFLAFDRAKVFILAIFSM